MKYTLLEKYTSEMSDEEIDAFSGMINRCLYLNTAPYKTVRELFFSHGDIYNFIVMDQDNLIGLFQAKDIPKIDSVYFFSASVLPDYRGEGVHMWITGHRLRYYKERGRKYAGARTMNPRAIENLVKKGFFLPTKENSELLQKAKEILIEVEGGDLGIRDDFVVLRKNVLHYPNIVDLGECKDPEINEFISAHMDIKEGDRLFLIREI